MRVFINGFGRIGRCAARILLNYPDCLIVGINDIVDDTENLAYLLKYDSNYGRLDSDIGVSEDRKNISIGATQKIPVFNARSLLDIDWNAIKPDVIIDCSGVQSNVEAAHELKRYDTLKGVVITHSPTQGIDQYVVMGVNDEKYDPLVNFVVSSSICDVNAIAHPLNLLDKHFGIISGAVTTIHPWLGYQNLTDSALKGQSNPSHYWPDYSLGRASAGNLIPKDTTAVQALELAVPSLAEKLESFSYRVPTAVVGSADITLFLNDSITQEQLNDALTKAFSSSVYVHLNKDSLISSDYIATSYSAAIDMQWAKVGKNNLVKLVLWYDNEWGYACRAVDVAKMIAGQGEKS